jgi:SAM-dependent methyltransferase
LNLKLQRGASAGEVGERCFNSAPGQAMQRVGRRGLSAFTGVSPGILLLLRRRPLAQSPWGLSASPAAAVQRPPELERDVVGPHRRFFAPAARWRVAQPHTPACIRCLSGRGAPSDRNISIFDEEDEGNELEAEISLLIHPESTRQLEGAKALSARLKAQALRDDEPVAIERLDSEQEERRARLRAAWNKAMEANSEVRVERETKAPEDEEDNLLLSTLGFGDVSFDMVAEALEAVDAMGLMPRRGGELSGGIFVDFTARGGQVALAAALLHPFDHVLGVESSEDACAHARSRLESLQESLAQIVGDDDKLTWEVSFDHSDGDESVDVEDSGLLAADFVAVNCIGLNDYKLNDLSEGFLGLRPNCVILCFGRRLPCPGMLLLDTRYLPSQIDDLQCFILQRTSDEHNAHLPPVDVHTCTSFPKTRETPELQRAAEAAVPVLVHLLAGIRPTPPGSGDARAAPAAGVQGAGAAAGEGGGGGEVRAEVRHMAAMTLSYCAHRERTAHALTARGSESSVVEGVVDLLGISSASMPRVSKEDRGARRAPPTPATAADVQPPLAAAAACVMLLRALGRHPCAVPALVDTPACIESLVSLLSYQHLAVAAGAADALLSCLSLVEARAVIVEAGGLAFLCLRL